MARVRSCSLRCACNSLLQYLVTNRSWIAQDSSAEAHALSFCAAFRALRTQQFLAFTAADLEARELKQKALLAEFEASRRGKLVSKAELDDFYQRLAVCALLFDSAA